METMRGNYYTAKKLADAAFMAYLYASREYDWAVKGGADDTTLAELQEARDAADAASREADAALARCNANYL